MRLINTHKAVIRERFRSWMTVPEDVRGDREAVQCYFNTLLMLATGFENAGDRTLKNWLMRQGEDNPLEGWQRDLERGQALIDEGRPAEAIPLLRCILDSARGAIGTAIDHHRPRVLGHLGITLARSGNSAEAIRVTREARDLCRNIGDEEGVRIYTANLDALGTFEIPSGAQPAERFVLAFIGEDGRTLAPDELPRIQGTFR